MLLKDAKVSVQVRQLRRTLDILPNPNVLVVISKDMWPVKLFCDKILQFLTGVLTNAGCPAYKWS